MDVPDNVIEEAHGAADRAWTDAEPWRGPRAFAGVIAAWARAEERERIRGEVNALRIGARAEMYVDQHKMDAAHDCALAKVLAALDREDK